MAGRQFQFLAYSSSQLKEQSVWMLASGPKEIQVGAPTWQGSRGVFQLKEKLVVKKAFLGFFLAYHSLLHTILLAATMVCPEWPEPGVDYYLLESKSLLLVQQACLLCYFNSHADGCGVLMQQVHQKVASISVSLQLVFGKKAGIRPVRLTRGVYSSERVNNLLS
eukprot:1162021-Pelagomonas_calceolata.AAC.6